MRQFVINEQQIEALAAYLNRKPHGEVRGLIDMVVALPEIGGPHAVQTPTREEELPEARRDESAQAK